MRTSHDLGHEFQHHVFHKNHDIEREDVAAARFDVAARLIKLEEEWSTINLFQINGPNGLL